MADQYGSFWEDGAVRAKTDFKWSVQVCGSRGRRRGHLCRHVGRGAGGCSSPHRPIGGAASTGPERGEHARS